MELPSTEAAYDSAQAALPAAKRDGRIKHFIAKKSIRINNKYDNRSSEFKEDFTEKFLHSLPKLMFVSLPFVALFLSLLYSFLLMLVQRSQNLLLIAAGLQNPLPTM